jgi:hypothetical protein
MRRGIGFALDQPARYLLLSLSRVRDYFEFWPTADSTLLYNVGRLTSFTLFLPFMIYGIILAVRRTAASSRTGAASPSQVHPEYRRATSSTDPSSIAHRHSSIAIRHSSSVLRCLIHASTSPTALLLLFIAFYFLLHILTWAMTRYRLPVDAVAIVFAALAIQDLAARLNAKT